MPKLIIPVKDAVFDGDDVILEHGDAVTTAKWNRMQENAGAAYSVPQKAMSCTFSLDVGTAVLPVNRLWGYVPPRNPAATRMTYPEYFEAGLYLGWLKNAVGRSDITVSVYGGTNPVSLPLLWGTTFDEPTDSLEQLLLAKQASPVYEDVHYPPYGPTDWEREAPAYYFSVEFTCDNNDDYTIRRCEIYYRKWVESPYPYTGSIHGEFDSTTGTLGTFYGTNGANTTIAGTHTLVNTVDASIESGTNPYSADYLFWNAVPASGNNAYVNGYVGETKLHPNKNYAFANYTFKFHVDSVDSAKTTRFILFEDLVNYGTGTENDVTIRISRPDIFGTTYNALRIYGDCFVDTGFKYVLFSEPDTPFTGFVPISMQGPRFDSGGYYLQFSALAATAGGINATEKFYLKTGITELSTAGALKLYKDVDSPGGYNPNPGIHEYDMSWSL